MMELKKVIALSVVTLSLTGIALSAAAATSVQSDLNRTWTYGKNGTTAISNILDNVATHSSSVYDYVTTAYNDSYNVPVRTTSYAKLDNVGTHTMMYDCSVAYWGTVLK